jgi:hypothetical protein
MELNPVKYDTDTEEMNTQHFGFVSEDVPISLADHDREDVIDNHIVAVLTKVVQEQQEVISAFAERISILERSVDL